jgi:hypothetical protein
MISLLDWMEDEAQWLPSLTNYFTWRSAWESIRARHQKLDWYRLNWFKGAIHILAFIAWLAIKIG